MGSASSRGGQDRPARSQQLWLLQKVSVRESGDKEKGVGGRRFEKKEMVALE